MNSTYLKQKKNKLESKFQWPISIGNFALFWMVPLFITFKEILRPVMAENWKMNYNNSVKSELFII